MKHVVSSPLSARVAKHYIRTSPFSIYLDRLFAGGSQLEGVKGEMIKQLITGRE